jgi:transcriptional regulator with GAF, ATPase, and Fis domain
MDNYVVMYRDRQFAKAVGKWHFSKGEYSSIEAEELAECLEAQGYEVYVNTEPPADVTEQSAIPGGPGYSLETELGSIENARIDAAVAASRGNVTIAALKLGMTLDKLYYRINRRKALAAHA